MESKKEELEREQVEPEELAQKNEFQTDLDDDKFAQPSIN
jgi:hypothetical protein